MDLGDSWVVKWGGGARNATRNAFASLGSSAGRSFGGKPRAAFAAADGYCDGGEPLQPLTNGQQNGPKPAIILGLPQNSTLEQLWDNHRHCVSTGDCLGDQNIGCFWHHFRTNSEQVSHQLPSVDCPPRCIPKPTAISWPGPLVHRGRSVQRSLSRGSLAAAREILGRFRPSESPIVGPWRCSGLQL